MVLRDTKAQAEKDMPLTSSLIDAAVERYWREIDRYEKLAVYVGEACQQLLEKHKIHGLVQWRAKDPGRLRLKLQKYLDTGEHAAEFVDLDSVFRVLKDLAGARITSYVASDRDIRVNSCLPTSVIRKAPQSSLPDLQSVATFLASSTTLELRNTSDLSASILPTFPTSWT